jgi:hypothetical protein
MRLADTIDHRWDGREQNMMNCLICGRTSQAGAKLCADCRSARKRAFAATVTQPLLLAAGAGRSSGRLLRPSQSVAATARRSAERALLSKPPAAESVASTSRRMDVIFFVAAVVVIVLIGAYIARQIHKARPADAPQVAEQPAQASAGAMPNTVSVMPAGLSPKNVAETRAPDPTGAIYDAEPAPIHATAADPAKRATSRQRSAPVENMAPPVEPAPPIVAAAPVPTPVPEVREAPRPDALQLMNDGLARCAGNLLDRILCDQRVRREYCDGRWGQVPQCSSGVANDHGQ